MLSKIIFFPLGLSDVFYVHENALSQVPAQKVIRDFVLQIGWLPCGSTKLSSADVMCVLVEGNNFVIPLRYNQLSTENLAYRKTVQTYVRVHSDKKGRE